MSSTKHEVYTAFMVIRLLRAWRDLFRFCDSSRDYESWIHSRLQHRKGKGEALFSASSLCNPLEEAAVGQIPFVIWSRPVNSPIQTLFSTLYFPYPAIGLQLIYKDSFILNTEIKMSQRLQLRQCKKALPFSVCRQHSSSRLHLV